MLPFPMMVIYNNNLLILELWFKQASLKVL